MGIEDAKQKHALLLHYSGPEVDKIFDTLEDTDEDKDYKKAVEKLTAYFNPQVTTTYKVYNFRKAQQNEGESFDSFHTRLGTLAKTCEFADADKEIKEQIILSCKSHALKRKALREDPFVPYSDALHQANLETLSGRRQSITNKLFNSITCNSDHKLHELLPPCNNCEFKLRRKKNFHVPLAKTKRLKNTFIYSNCN